MRTTRSYAKRKRRGRTCNRDLTPQRSSARISTITPQSHLRKDSTPLSSDDLLKITVMKESIREYYRIPERREDASRLSLGQIVFVKASPDRFNNLDFLFYEDDFLWTHIVPMRASRQESSLTDEEIPLSVKASHSRLRAYRDTNREGRMMERY